MTAWAVPPPDLGSADLTLGSHTAKGEAPGTVQLAAAYVHWVSNGLTTEQPKAFAPVGMGVFVCVLLQKERHLYGGSIIFGHEVGSAYDRIIKETFQLTACTLLVPVSSFGQ